MNVTGRSEASLGNALALGMMRVLFTIRKQSVQQGRRPKMASEILSYKVSVRAVD